MSVFDTGIPYGFVKVKCVVCGKEFYIDIDVEEVPPNPICENCLEDLAKSEKQKYDYTPE